MRHSVETYAASNRSHDERGLALVIALSVMALLLVGAVVLLRVVSIDRDVAANTVAAEGAFFAADAAVNVALDTIAPDVESCASARTPIGGGYAYQVLHTPPNASCFTGTQRLAGYSAGSGTGYNASGYVFYTFAFTGVGTGPRSTQRTIEARAVYGPIAQ
jgi:Tfp pilus assembly protein PilX